MGQIFECSQTFQMEDPNRNHEDNPDNADLITSTVLPCLLLPCNIFSFYHFSGYGTLFSFSNVRLRQ